MRRVHEYEAWSRPGQLLPSDYGKNLQSEFWNLGIPTDVFLGLDSIPDRTDSEGLRIAIERGEFSKQDFGKFCAGHSLPDDLNCAESACRFLEISLGRCLAWIHIPDGEEPQLMPRISELLAVRGHIVVDPDNS